MSRKTRFVEWQGKDLRALADSNLRFFFISLLFYVWYDGRKTLVRNWGGDCPQVLWEGCPMSVEETPAIGKPPDGRGEQRSKLQKQPPDFTAMKPEDMEALVHNLEIHQAELEAQNED